jgi:hypothetical protein
MRPVWLLEADVFGEAIEPLKAEIRRQGMSFHVVRQLSRTAGPHAMVGAPKLPEDACVICCGSLPLLRHIQLRENWTPGGWCSAENLDCANYFPRLGALLLNRPYTILTGVDAIARRDALFAEFAKSDEVFVRPSGVHKLFTGRCVTPEEFADALAPTRYDPTSLVVVAQPRNVAREWRLVVAGDRVVASSQYARQGAKALSPGCPPWVSGFADRVLKEMNWRPDDLFMMDVGECEGSLYVVELNGFSCSGLYECDLRAVVQAAVRAAIRAWEARWSVASETPPLATR